MWGDMVANQDSADSSEARTVVLVDDQPEFLELASQLLGEDPRLEIVGTATTHEEAASLVSRLRPQVVVHDVYMPGSEVALSAKRLKKTDPELVLILMSSYDEPQYHELAPTIGAKAFLTKKNLSADALIDILIS